MLGRQPIWTAGAWRLGDAGQGIECEGQGVSVPRLPLLSKALMTSALLFFFTGTSAADRRRNSHRGPGDRQASATDHGWLLAHVRSPGGRLYKMLGA